MSRSDDPHAPLRDDVRLLGALLGESFRSIEGQWLFDMVEEVRAMAKRGRSDEAAFRQLGERLATADSAQLVLVARAFAHFLGLANIAEQHHRIRRRRAYRRDPDATPQRGSCEQAFAQLVADGVPPQALYDAVEGLRIELVLTAHPTEIVRRLLRKKQHHIAALLAQRDRAALTLDEREGGEQELRRAVLATWSTDEVRRVRPTPLDEVEWGLVVFEESLWRAVPRYLRSLDRALVRATGRPMPLSCAPIRFGSWIGGDRDGNPNVTPLITERACLLARWMAASLYLPELEALRDELTMRSGSAELCARSGDEREPYRVLLRALIERLRNAQRVAVLRLAEDDNDDGAAPLDDAFVAASDVAEVLALCHRSLCESGLEAVADGRLRDLQRRVACFGLSLVRLDIRQESTRHTQALDALTRALDRGKYADWQEPARQAFLLEALATGAPLLPTGWLDDVAASDEVRDVWATVDKLAQLPAEDLGAYVISMATAPSDVLAVMLLMQQAGVAQPLRVVPLFETIDDLERAGETMRTLLALEPYARSVRDCHSVAEVMIGYSDSAKDGGRLASAWMLYVAQREIVAACRDHGVPCSLFHGRGGTVGRGGGPTHLAIRSQPPGSVDGGLRVTVQGEMLEAKLGLEGIAERTLEVYTTATLEATLRPPAEPSAAWQDRMTILARASRDSYRALVHEDADFRSYFRQATPAPELGDIRIGSRPARRRSGSDVDGLRAIPWVFSWTQTRLMLPSWLGVGDALEHARQQGWLSELRQMHRQWPFFQSTMELIEMVLAKSDLRIAAEYDAYLVEPGLHVLGEQLRTRLARTAELLGEVTGHGQLLENNLVLRRSIDVRNPYVDPINLAQVQILKRLRHAADDELVTALHGTVNGIAAGMRNTG